MLKSISNFPSSKTVSVKVIDNTGSVHLDWDSSIVTEVAIASSKSIYHADLTVITPSFKGFIFWKTSDAIPLVSAEALNVYAVVGFPSSKTVYFKTVDSTGTTVDDWTNTDVTEYVIDSTAARSVYLANPPGITSTFNGVLLWKDNSSTPRTASEAIRGIPTVATTTSGSYDFNLTRNEIIKLTLQKIRKLAEGQDPSASQIDTATKYLNMMVKAWQNEQIFLWATDWTTKTFSSSSKVLGSDSETYTCILNHTAASTNKPITGANYTTYWKKTGTSGSAWVSSADYTSIGEFLVDSHIMDIQGAFIRSGTFDTPLNIISMPSFFEFSDKTTSSIPTTLIFERKRNPRVYLWPQPDATSYVLHYLAVRKLQDFDNSDDNSDFDSRWLDAVVSSLAYKLCGIYNVPMNERILLKQESEELKMLAKGYTRDTEESLFISPQMR
jgi:hypothetical protein